MVFPLKETLQVNKKYNLSFEYLQGCNNNFFAIISEERPCPLALDLPVHNVNGAVNCNGWTFKKDLVIKPSLLVGPDWNTTSIDFIPKSKALFLTIYIALNSPKQNGSSFYIDNIKIEEDNSDFTFSRGCSTLGLSSINNLGTQKWTIKKNSTIIATYNGIPPSSINLPAGVYQVTHEACSFSTTKDITVISCEGCGSCNNQLYNIGKANTSTSIKNTAIYNVLKKVSNIPCIDIAGELVIDDDFTFDNCTITMEAFSRIKVKSGKKLTIINSSYLHGCDEMWYGIKVETDASIEMLSSKISDAIEAVNVIDGSIFNIQGCTFEANYNGITAYGDISKTIIPIRKGDLISNTFTSGHRKLLNGGTSFSGFDLAYCILSIGIFNQTVNANNVFEDLVFGINARSSLISIRQAEMTNIKNTGVKMNFSNYVTGRNLGSHLSIERSSFINMPTAIDCAYSSFYGKAITTDDVAVGITILIPEGNVRIQDCNDIKYSRKGIVVNGSILGAVSQPYIQNVVLNRIDKNNTIGNTPIGLSLSYFNAIPYNYFLVTDIVNNTVINNTSQDPTMAANISNVTGVKILRHDVNRSLGIQVHKAVNNGIFISYSDGIRMKDSYIKLTKGSSYVTNAINIDECVNTWLCCNTTINSFAGINTYGKLGGFRLRHHIFENHTSGLNSFRETELSEQKDAKNRFLNNSNKSAEWIPATGVPISNYQPYINASKLKINDPYFVGSEYWGYDKKKIVPNLINPGTIVSNNPDWLEKISLINPVTNCSTDPLCDASLFRTVEDESENIATINDTMSARGYFRSAPHGEMASWRSARFLFSRLSEHPLLRVNNAMLDSFYTANISSSIGKLYEIERKIKLLPVLSDNEKTTLVSLNLQIDSLEKSINLITKQMTNNNSDILLNQSILYHKQLKIVFNRYQNEFASAKSARLNRVNTIKRENGLISTDKIWEQNEKEVNDVLLSSILAYTLELTPEQQNKIRAIAFQCESEGGKSVIAARGIYQLIEERVFPLGEFCSNNGFKEQTQGKKVFIDNKQFSVTVSPNPAYDEVRVNTNISGCEIKLFSLEGKLMYRNFSPEFDTIIDTRQFPSGIYNCQISYQNKWIENKKIVIIK